MNIDARTEFANSLARSAGSLAKEYFSDHQSLTIDRKGPQDWVSEADREVERFVRSEISKAWPNDGIVGEEFGAEAGDAEFLWVIDPIDGTTNFVNGIPNWTVVLAGVSGGQTQTGVIHDPMLDETFAAQLGRGASLNGESLRVALGTALKDGTVAVGYSNRVTANNIVPVVGGLIAKGAMFHRNASGALSLAYVAAGRFLGYLEEHMNAWDCLAGQLLVKEAGGIAELQSADTLIRGGGRIVAQSQGGTGCQPDGGGKTSHVQRPF